jgi:hypothetical protein
MTDDVKTDKERLVQTTVSPELGRWLEAEAGRAGMSTAAYVRRLVIAKHTAVERKRAATNDAGAVARKRLAEACADLDLLTTHAAGNGREAQDQARHLAVRRFIAACAAYTEAFAERAEEDRP